MLHRRFFRIENVRPMIESVQFSSENVAIIFMINFRRGNRARSQLYEEDKFTSFIYIKLG